MTCDGKIRLKMNYFTSDFVQEIASYLTHALTDQQRLWIAAVLRLVERQALGRAAQIVDGYIGIARIRKDYEMEDTLRTIAVKIRSLDEDKRIKD